MKISGVNDYKYLSILYLDYNTNFATFNFDASYPVV